MGRQSKTSDLKKTANQFLILIGLEQLHAACVIVMDLDTLHQIDYSFTTNQSELFSASHARLLTLHGNDAEYQLRCEHSHLCSRNIMPLGHSSC